MFGKFTKCILFFCVLGLTIPGHAIVIRDFNTDVHLQKNGAFSVTETVVVDFENTSHHGIYRNIPIKYPRYNSIYSIYIKNIQVLDRNNNPVDFKTIRKERFLNIDIGKSNELLTGVHTYCIQYTVLRALNFIGGEPEVYWNATGNDWKFPILRATARFFPPADVPANQLRTVSFQGMPEFPYKSIGRVERNDVLFTSTNRSGGTKLDAGEGLSFAVRLPVGSVSVPVSNSWSWLFIDWWPAIILPLLSLILLLVVYLQRVKYLAGNQAIGVEWAPPNDLSPAEVDVLVNLNCNERSITATIFDLAARGYLQIHEVDRSMAGKAGYNHFSSKDYLLVKTSPNAKDQLAKHEDLLLTNIFRNAATIDSLPIDLKNKIITDQQVNQKEQMFPPQAAGANNFGLAPIAFGENGIQAKVQNQLQSQLAPIVNSTNQAVLLSNISSTIFQNFKSYKDSVYDELMDKKIYTTNPKNNNTFPVFGSGMSITVGIALYIVSLFSYVPGLPWYIGTTISILLFDSAPRFLCERTAKGNLRLRQCKGFERFVKLVEEPRLKLMNDANPEIFGRLLPYALVLNVSDQWAEGFEHIITRSPYYYFGSNLPTSDEFSPRFLIHSMGSSVHGINNTFASVISTAGSGGSGFNGGSVGGGFGGGGGGAW